MYGWVWRKLPGPAAVRALEMLVGAAAIVLLSVHGRVPCGAAVAAIQ